MKLTEYTYKEEFDFIFKKYLAPLIGVNITGISLEEIPNKKGKLVQIDNQKLCFYETSESKFCYAIQISKNFPNQCLGLLNSVYDGLNQIRYREMDGKIKNSYQDFEQLVTNYEYIVQKKVVNWLCGNQPSTGVLKLIDILQDWNSKTYEGKKVPFAFTVDLSRNDGNFAFEDFLYEEYSATFSDGITSIIHLDANLNFLDYASITSLENEMMDYKDTPYRFCQVIKSFTKNKIGVFLLTSGDIILVKNCIIELVKREGKWLNFNKDVFIQVVSANINSNTDFDISNLLNEVYLSALDVSFSHSGGIIACIDPAHIDDLLKPNEYEFIKGNYEKIRMNREIIKTAPKSIINYIDNLHATDELNDYEYNRKTYPIVFDNEEMKKRFKKREFLLYISKDKIFQTLDRKLRTEFISMDGATIIDYTGKIISIGAIIQNDSGSYGGGRGAAAKKLSNYGFAIKISTDGYIEVYTKERIKYKIK